MAELDPSNQTWQYWLGSAHAGLADVFIAQGDSTAALASYQTAAKLIRQGPGAGEDMGRQLRLARIYGSIGSTQRTQGDYSAALTSHRAVLAMVQKTAAIDPGNSSLQMALASVQSALAHDLGLQGDLNASLRNALESMAIRQRVATTDPSNTDSQLAVSASHLQLAAIQMRRTDLSEAMANVRSAARSFRHWPTPIPRRWEFRGSWPTCSGRWEACSCWRTTCRRQRDPFGARST
jgi:tetratricopeptide (TPR) repeat protein